jgi:hypothetical protein
MPAMTISPLGNLATAVGSTLNIEIFKKNNNVKYTHTRVSFISDIYLLTGVKRKKKKT